jgi:hypothetical protein
MAKKQISDFTKLWAQQIYRLQRGEKGYIVALVRRKYGERDVEPVGPGEYVGMKQQPIYEMTTDSDPDSDTFNERVPKEITVYDASGRELKQKVQTGVDWIPTDEDTQENLTKYRQLIGAMPKPFGDTQFYWLFKEGKRSAENADEFFDTPIKKVRDILIVRKSSLKRAKKADDKEDTE